MSDMFISYPIDLPRDIRPVFCRVCFGTINSSTALETHLGFHEEVNNHTMSNVKWCDPGDHAFKAGTPGSQSGTMTVTNEDGLPVVQTMDACKDHAFRSATTPALANPSDANLR